MLKGALWAVVLGPVLGIMSGCSGGGAGSSAAIIDMDAVGGTGTFDQPYTLPAEFPDNTSGGMEAYFAHKGFWKVNFERIQVNLRDANPSFGSLLYDSAADHWLITIDNADYELTRIDKTDPFYEADGCTDTSCTTFVWSDIPDVSQYGAVAFVGHETGVDTESLLLLYGGMKTPVDKVPATGSGFYHGIFLGATEDGTAQYALITENLTVSAFFGEKRISVTAADEITSDLDENPVSQRFTFEADAQLSGNNFVSNTAIATRYELGSGPIPGPELDTYKGTLRGAFFGPKVDEVTGVFDTTSPVSGYKMWGGFWGERDTP